MIQFSKQRACENCRHYRPIVSEQDGDGDLKFAVPIEQGEYGKCTRYPPVFFYPKLLNAEFPVVRFDNCCGEYSRELM